jgi:hypothetical protein
MLTCLCFTDAALLQYKEVQKMRNPDPENLAVLNEWLERPLLGNFFLRGHEAEIYDRAHFADMVAISGEGPDQKLVPEVLLRATLYRVAQLWPKSKVTS